jgi:hypothetical protein
VTSRWSAERGQPKSISETLARMAALVTRLLCLGHYLANQRIVVPGYSTMQDTVGRALVRSKAAMRKVENDGRE